MSTVDEKNKQDYMKRMFDMEIRQLFNELEDTITTKYKNNNNRQEYNFLMKYKTIYNNMEPEDHYIYFDKLYDRYKTDILNSVKDDRWLINGRVSIQYLDGVSLPAEKEEKVKQVRIMLSEIYKMAVDIQRETDKMLESLGNEFLDEKGKKDLIRPQLILLRLARIFYHLQSDDGEEKGRVGLVVTDLEMELGIKERTVGSEPWKNVVAVSGPIKGLFDMATGFMNKLGIAPPNAKIPSEQDFSNIVNNIFNNEITQKLLQGTVSSLKDTDDFGSAFQNIIKNISEPDTLNSLQETIKQTTQESLNNPPEQNSFDFSNITNSISSLLQNTSNTDLTNKISEFINNMSTPTDTSTSTDTSSISYYIKEE